MLDHIANITPEIRGSRFIFRWAILDCWPHHAQMIASTGGASTAILKRIESSSPALPQERLRWVTNPGEFNNSVRVASAGPLHGSMAQSLSKILIHTVFSTKERRPFLRDKTLREELHRYLGGIIANHDCQPIIVGGFEDHVHILSTLSRTCQAAELVKEIKRGSSLWVKSRSPEMRDFAWQNGYGVFSIGSSQVQVARTYIGSQEMHHRKVSFQDEFRELLRRYEMEFDERYVWD
jgi:putative transposase